CTMVEAEANQKSLPHAKAVPRIWWSTMKKFFRLWFVTAFSITLVSVAAEPTLTSNDLPRFPAIEPKDALTTFRVKKGFHMELAASEPNVVSPVALSFDENGRMYVVEMIDYSERREEVPHLGRIRLLEDTAGDGVFDKSTVFAENLQWPTAVF